MKYDLESAGLAANVLKSRGYNAEAHLDCNLASKVIVYLKNALNEDEIRKFEEDVSREFDVNCYALDENILIEDDGEDNLEFI